MFGCGLLCLPPLQPPWDQVGFVADHSCKVLYRDQLRSLLDVDKYVKLAEMEVDLGAPGGFTSGNSGR